MPWVILSSKPVSTGFSLLIDDRENVDIWNSRRIPKLHFSRSVTSCFLTLLPELLIGNSIDLPHCSPCLLPVVSGCLPGRLGVTKSQARFRVKNIAPAQVAHKERTRMNLVQNLTSLALNLLFIELSHSYLVLC